jgi:hypothetical protein
MRTPIVVAVASLWLVLASGCGNDRAEDDGSAGLPSTGSNGADDPDDPITAHYQLQWGPITVPASTESTQCIWLHLSNTSEIKVHQLHNVLGDTSHHLIVYKDDMDTTEQLTPVPCQPFTGALNTTGNIFPMMITQKHDDLLDLPHHVAYTLAPQQMIKIEMHYLNAGEDAAPAMAAVDFGASDPSTIKDEANLLFIGTPDIKLPPNQMTTVHEFFTPSLAGLNVSTAKFFALTGHTHKLGLSVDINTAPAANGPFTPVYDPASFLWSEPVTQTFDPELTMSANDGFDFTCNYFNDTGSTVTFGESTSNEMCFFWAYYYPSNGSHVCVHTDQLGLDICCPDAGEQLCSLISSKL